MLVIIELARQSQLFVILLTYILKNRKYNIIFYNITKLNINKYLGI